MAILPPPRPHHHPEKGPSLERSGGIDLDAAAIGHVRGAIGDLPLQRGIELPYRRPHVRACRQVHGAGIHKNSDGFAHRRLETNPGRVVTSTG